MGKRTRKSDRTPRPTSQPTVTPQGHLDTEAAYICDACGEEIVVPVDVSAGAHQDYVEDCPVCCHPMRLHVDVDDAGDARIEGEQE